MDWSDWVYMCSTHTHTHIHAYTHIHRHTQACVHTHTHTDTHTHTHQTFRTGNASRPSVIFYSNGNMKNETTTRRNGSARKKNKIDSVDLSTTPDERSPKSREGSVTG